MIDETWHFQMKKGRDNLKFPLTFSRSKNIRNDAVNNITVHLSNSAGTEIVRVPLHSVPDLKKQR